MTGCFRSARNVRKDIYILTTATGEISARTVIIIKIDYFGKNMKKQDKNKQIIPLAIMLLFLTASYSFASASGSGKGNFSQRQAMGKSLPLPAAEATEYDPCGLDSVVCEDEGGSPAIVSPSFNGGTRETPSFLPVEQQIRQIAEKENFQYTSYLLRLAWCESRYNPKARNDNGKYGMDRGLFQINNRYHPTVSDAQADDIVFATKWTMEKINQGKQHLWACNKIIKNN